MTFPWTTHSQTLVIAHRGASAHAPENTLAAFQKAVTQGADAIELDVKLTTDNQVVVIHDQTVDRTTDGHGQVTKMPLAALRELDAGSFFHKKFRGEKIPTLEEVFELLGKKILLNIELTNYASPTDQLVTHVITLVKKHSMESRVLLSSFFRRNLRIAQQLSPDIPCGLLAARGVLGVWARTFDWRRSDLALHPFFTDIKETLVRRVHAAGQRVNVWTINNEQDLSHMLDLKVDGVISDNPLLICRALGRKI